MPDPSKNTERETRILNAAAELIAHYGYDKTTMEDIARHAGISKGALYLHFKGKEELVESLILRETEIMLNDLLARIENDERGITIFTIYKHAIVTMMSRPLLRAMFMNDRRVFGEVVIRLKRLPAYQQMTAIGVDFVRHFQAAGLLRSDLPADTVAYILIALRVGLLYAGEFIPAAEAPSMERIGETLAEMLEKALAPEHIEAADRERGHAALLGLMQMGRELIHQQREERERAKEQGDKP